MSPYPVIGVPPVGQQRGDKVSFLGVNALGFHLTHTTRGRAVLGNDWFTPGTASVWPTRLWEG